MSLSLFTKKVLAKVGLGLLILAFAYLLYLPANYFDEGQSICLSVVLLDTQCYGCGMTRGIQHLIHGEFSAAWEFNKLSFIVFPLASFLFSFEIYKVLTAKEEDEPKAS